MDIGFINLSTVIYILYNINKIKNKYLSAKCEYVHMSLRLEVEESLEERFREAAMKAHGYGKGALKKAAAEAFEFWVNMEGKNGLAEVEDPVKLMEGILSKFKGKYTSVQLQHESKFLWTKKQ